MPVATASQTQLRCVSERPSLPLPPPHRQRLIAVLGYSMGGMATLALDGFYPHISRAIHR